MKKTSLHSDVCETRIYVAVDDDDGFLCVRRAGRDLLPFPALLLSASFTHEKVSRCSQFA